MEKIRNVLSNMSLKKALLVTAGSILLIVTALSAVTIITISGIRQELLNTRPIVIKDIGKTETQFAYVLSPENYSYGELTGKHRMYYNAATAAMVVFPVMYIILGAAAVAKMYYRIKLSQPIEALKTGISHVSEYDLDFQIAYRSDDELGMLCSTFENMRKELAQNNQKMWDLLQERKLLNASVSHDLRTPITVIKGYLDYLAKASDRGKLTEESLKLTVQNMVQSAERLERYVDCIKDIHRMEEIEVKKMTISISELTVSIERDFSFLAEQRNRSFQLCNLAETACICTDRSLLFKILENLLDNAFRFSKEKITLTITESSGYISFMMQDDGKGFSDAELGNAAGLFYRSAVNKGELGIGLTICQILCEKLDGVLALKNNEAGGAAAEVRLKKCSVQEGFFRV